MNCSVPGSRKARVMFLALTAFLCAPISVGLAEDSDSSDSKLNFLSNIRQVTFEGRRSGEGYFSADGSKMIFQSERDPANPFYQIFVLDLNTGDTQLVSPGHGKTTCAWIHPNGKRALFASTHDDPQSLALQKAESERRAAGTIKRYEWDYDEHFEIYTTKLGSNEFTNLTHARGYDAEGSYSPDGKWIAFSSNRHAYTDKLPAEEQQLLANDSKYFLEIYVMRADGSDVKRLTDVPGYDGGPFFSPDSKRICWRRFTPEGNIAEIWTMNIDGSDQKQITKLGGMSWAPYYHPSGDYLIFTTDINGRSNFELYIVDAEGKHEPVRVSNLPGFDGLPVFFPDGKRLAWTANRTQNKKGQIYFADFDDAQARQALSAAPIQRKIAVSATDSDSSNTTSPLITENDLAFRRKNALKNFESASEGSWIFSDLARYGFKVTKTPEGVDGQAVFPFELRPAHAIENETVYWVHLMQWSNEVSARNKFASECATLIEVAEYLSTKLHANDQGKARPLTFHLIIVPQDTDEDKTVKQAFESIGSGHVAAIVTRGFESSSGRFAIDGVGTSDIWSQIIERLNVPIGIPIEISTEPKLNSIAYSMHEKQIPAISIYPVQGKQDSSTANNEDVNIDTRATRLTARLIESLITIPDAPRFTPITQRADAAKGRPYLGTEPDYRAKVEGVLLKGVKENGPAHLGGMRAGDVIVQIGDSSIKNVQAYADALDTLSADETILVVVMRDGERVLLRVTVGEREQ